MSPRPSHSLGRRLLPAVAMTAAASGLIALLDRPSSGSAGDALGGGVAAVPGQGLPAVQSEPPLVSSTVPAIVPAVGQGDDGGGDDGGDDDGAAPQPAATTTAPAQTQTQTPTPTPTPAANGVCEGKTVDGPSVNTRWGPVQVEAVVSSSGQICNVGAIRSPSSRRRSVSINQQALPILHDQVMKAQSTQIRGVSGATVTSEGYVTSLQAILDGKAG